jgi:hypothetical protein
MRSLAALILLAPLAVPAAADVLCPRVISEHNADTSDLGRFRRFHRWKDKTGGDLAIAIWQYLSSRETGLFHMETVNDGPDPWSEYSTVRDPLKLLNIYNVGYCGIFGPALDGIFQGAGFDAGRAFGVSGWNHCTTEVWYDGGWHYFDLDVRGALMKPDGSIASLAEARSRRELWVDPERRIEPFFPKDRDKGRIFEIYRDSRIDYFYRWFQMGHSMDFRLRQGESLTRWWHPQGGRWHHIEDYDSGFVRDLLVKEPRGYKSNHPEFSIWTQGNGLWRYQPDLRASSSDFEDGVESARNLRPGPEGLELIEAGSGEAVFEVFTPWTIVPRVGDPADESDDAEASVLRLDAARPLAVEVSLDHGRTWKGAASLEAGAAAVDLTRWVKGRYGFLFKLRTSGGAGDLALRRLSIESWVQVAPIGLPRLARGVNRCRYELGDRYGGSTRPRFVLPNAADAEDLGKHVLEMPSDYDPERRTARIRGDVVLKLEAPEGASIEWLTAGACFTTHQNDGAERTDNRIAYAAGTPETFKEIYRAAVPNWVNHWRYQWDEDVRLETPARVIYVRYSGRPAVNVLRATLHLRPAKPSGRSLRITHAYDVDGKRVEKVVERDEPGDYTVDVDGDPQNVFVRMEAPSRTR